MEPVERHGQEVLKIEPIRRPPALPMPPSLALFLNRYIKDAFYEQNTVTLTIDWDAQKIIITEPSPTLKAPIVTTLSFEDLSALSIEKTYSGRYMGYVLGAIFVLRNDTLKSLPLSATQLFRFEQLALDLGVPLRRI